VEGASNERDLGKARLRGYRIEVRGDHNLLQIHPSCRLVNVSFRLIGDNLRLELGERVKISQWSEFLLKGEDVEVRLGPKCTVESARFVAHSRTSLEVGPDYIFAYDVEVRTGNDHSTLDAASGERHNRDKNVCIGEHLRPGARSVVVKGVNIGDNSVIATGSIVSRDIGSGVVAAGVRARVIRDGIAWDRRRL
jgi:acetyltransferase-like isoleucine patch superfamily enzyme